MLFALSDFVALNLLVSSSAAVQAASLPPFSFLVRVAGSGKKGCQPAGQIFIVITSRKGIFPACSPAERNRVSIDTQTDFRSWIARAHCTFLSPNRKLRASCKRLIFQLTILDSTVWNNNIVYCALARWSFSERFSTFPRLCEYKNLLLPKHTWRNITNWKKRIYL